MKQQMPFQDTCAVRRLSHSMPGLSPRESAPEQTCTATERLTRKLQWVDLDWRARSFRLLLPGFIDQVVRDEAKVHIERLEFTDETFGSAVKYQARINANPTAFRQLHSGDKVNDKEGRARSGGLTDARNSSQVGTFFRPTFMSVQFASSSLAAWT